MVLFMVSIRSRSLASRYMASKLYPVYDWEALIEASSSWRILICRAFSDVFFYHR